MSRCKIAEIGVSDASEPAALSSQAKWNSANPKALWAHNAVRSAIKRGLIERKACEVCGEEETDAHHDDYDRPLLIRWLCRLHHRADHRKKGCQS